MADLHLDECLDSDLLVKHLTGDGHTVETPRTARLIGRSDADQLTYATSAGRIIITQNVDDFVDLFDRWQAEARMHEGILLIYHDANGRKKMTPADIVRAVRNFLASGIAIQNEIYVLNHWR